MRALKVFRAMSVILFVLLTATAVGVRAQGAEGPYSFDLDLLPALLQAVAFGGVAPTLAYAFMEWLKAKWPTVSPYATRNWALVVSGLFGLGAWGFLMLIEIVPPPVGPWHVWLRYAVSIIGSSGTMGQVVHGQLNLSREPVLRVP